MNASSSFPEEFQMYKDILVAGPLPQHLRRKRDRTMSLGHGEYTLERDSQTLFGRVQGTDFAHVEPSRNALSSVEPSLDDILTGGLSGSAFIRTFTAKSWTIALDLATPLQVSLHNPQKSGSAQDVDLSVRSKQIPTSKYTAEHCAERKACKKERRAQQKQQNERQATALLVSEEAGAMSDIIEQFTPPHSLTAKKKSRRARYTPPTSQSHELPQQISILPTVSAAVYYDTAVLAPASPGLALLEASRPCGDLTWPGTVVLRPSSLAFWLTLFWPITGIFTRRRCSSHQIRKRRQCLMLRSSKVKLRLWKHKLA